MALTIIAAVAFWMEFRSNEKINEAQLVMELNDQFITNEQFFKVEWELEKYYEAYNAAKQAGQATDNIPFGLNLSLETEERQYLVNYLVHLEGIAALVNEGVLHLNVITDLMAYRYFIAVNNPLVQEIELIPCRDYYRGIFRIYKKWSRKLGKGKIPMEEHSLLKHRELNRIEGKIKK